MVDRDKLVEWMNGIKWRQLANITPDALALIEEHITKIRYVINQVCSSQQISVVEAHGFAQTPAHDSEYYDRILDDLFTKVQFIDSEDRESIIFMISACYCWDLDEDLKDLPNPWIPLLKLFDMGYTAAPVDDPEEEHVSIEIGCKDEYVEFSII